MMAADYSFNRNVGIKSDDLKGVAIDYYRLFAGASDFPNVVVALYDTRVNRT
jgi:hypothetical protein